MSTLWYSCMVLYMWELQKKGLSGLDRRVCSVASIQSRPKTGLCTAHTCEQRSLKIHPTCSHFLASDEHACIYEMAA